MVLECGVYFENLLYFLQFSRDKIHSRANAVYKALYISDTPLMLFLFPLNQEKNSPIYFMSLIYGLSESYR